jgi:uncharacterized protein (TIGR02145 family)
VYCLFLSFGITGQALINYVKQTRTKMKSTLQNLKLLAIALVAVFFASCDDDEKPKTAPVVTTAAVTDITTTTAMGGGTITANGNAAVTASGLVYSSVVGLPTIENDKVELTDTEGDFSALMENLTSGTTYRVRAYATNSVGTGYGEVVEFTTGNAAPTATNILVTGTLEVNKLLTATYTYADSENDIQGATTFQWYAANDAAGAGEAAIAGATANTFTVQDAQQGKYIRIGITPKAATGNTTGSEVKSAWFGAIGEATTVTFTYNGQSVTYGIISSPTGKKWLDRNLGAPNAPTSATDFANYGDLYQWGRGSDGHQLIARGGPTDANMSGVNGTTNTSAPFEYSSSDTPGHSKFIVVDATLAPFDWRVPQNNNLWQGVSGINNPCPSGWRLATSAEWTAENLGTITDAYTKLKITFASTRDGATGSFFQSATSARYWTSTVTGTDVFRVTINSSGTTTTAAVRANGYPCRCIKN